MGVKYVVSAEKKKEIVKLCGPVWYWASRDKNEENWNKQQKTLADLAFYV